jgi:hypothetical protein
LQILHIQAGFSSQLCWVLHGIALPVVSEWCQESMDASGCGNVVVTEVL